MITSEGVIVSSAVTHLQPWSPSSLGFLVLGEHITLPILAETALILAGVALTRNRATRRPTKRRAALGKQPGLRPPPTVNSAPLAPRASARVWC
jgi:hypothetical protein